MCQNLVNSVLRNVMHYWSFVYESYNFFCYNDTSEWVHESTLICELDCVVDFLEWG